MAIKSEFDISETERRREEALKRMLSTPHQPHKPVKKTGERKAPSRKQNTK